MKKLAIFHFEASLTVGAGHAIRSCVLADALVAEGWSCKVVTTSTTYDFIPRLDRFERIEPDNFYQSPLLCDLLVVDNYESDQVYEKHFRPYAKEIMVIDDLANRQHDCDILLDQAYGRDAYDYRNLVPQHCKILAGSDYVLLRKEFVELRPKSLKKRSNTTEVKRILISMGGSDIENYTLKALEMIKESGFAGAVDIVLGFTSKNLESVKRYVNSLPNACTTHVNADMPKLMYEADLAIGAAGSSVWERCCLGLPQCLLQTADNQIFFLKNLNKFVCTINFRENPLKTFIDFVVSVNANYIKSAKKISNLVDLMGIKRVVNCIKGDIL